MDNDDWKKSYVPVERRGDDALVMHVRDDGSREFIVAHGYDEESGHWGHGSYYDSVATAAAELEGRAISDTDDVVLADFWTRQDVANALTEADRPATEGNIDAVLSELGLDRYPYGSPFMESIAQMGNEAIADAVGRTGLPDAGARGATLPGRETPDGGSVRAWFMGDSVRDWYTDAYPDDDLGPEIAPDLSFLSALGAVSRGGGFYDVLGVGDSAVRERVFHELAKRTGLTYDDIYGAWIEEKPVKGFPQHEITKEGATYADSRKVDALLDSRGEMRVGDHKAAARGDASLSAQAEAMRSSSTALSQGGGHGEDVPPRPVGR